MTHFRYLLLRDVVTSRCNIRQLPILSCSRMCILIIVILENQKCYFVIVAAMLLLLALPPPLSSCSRESKFSGMSFIGYLASWLILIADSVVELALYYEVLVKHIKMFNFNLWMRFGWTCGKRVNLFFNKEWLGSYYWDVFPFLWCFQMAGDFSQICSLEKSIWFMQWIIIYNPVLYILYVPCTDKYMWILNL